MYDVIIDSYAQEGLCSASMSNFGQPAVTCSNPALEHTAAETILSGKAAQIVLLIKKQR